MPKIKTVSGHYDLETDVFGEGASLNHEATDEKRGAVHILTRTD